MTTPQTRTWTALEVAQVLVDAYEVGRMAERQRIIDDAAETRAIWSTHQLIRITPEQRIAERIADMEAHAFRAATPRQVPPGHCGSGTYPGGPVDFETGATLRTAHLTVVREAA